jgi:hypothetical protein
VTVIETLDRVKRSVFEPAFLTRPLPRAGKNKSKNSHTVAVSTGLLPLQDPVLDYQWKGSSGHLVLIGIGIPILPERPGDGYIAVKVCQ